MIAEARKSWMIMEVLVILTQVLRLYLRVRISHGEKGFKQSSNIMQIFSFLGLNFTMGCKVEMWKKKKKISNMFPGI